MSQQHYYTPKKIKKIINANPLPDFNYLIFQRNAYIKISEFSILMSGLCIDGFISSQLKRDKNEYRKEYLLELCYSMVDHVSTKVPRLIRYGLCKDKFDNRLKEIQYKISNDDNEYDLFGLIDLSIKKEIQIPTLMLTSVIKKFEQEYDQLQGEEDRKNFAEKYPHLEEKTTIDPYPYCSVGLASIYDKKNNNHSNDLSIACRAWIELFKDRSETMTIDQIKENIISRYDCQAPRAQRIAQLIQPTNNKPLGGRPEN